MGRDRQGGHLVNGGENLLQAVTRKVKLPEHFARLTEALSNKRAQRYMRFTSSRGSHHHIVIYESDYHILIEGVDDVRDLSNFIVAKIEAYELRLLLRARRDLLKLAAEDRNLCQSNQCLEHGLR